MTEPAEPKKNNAFQIPSSLAVLLVWRLALAYAQCACDVITGPNMSQHLPSGDRATAPHLAVVPPSPERVAPSVNTAHPL